MGLWWVLLVALGLCLGPACGGGSAEKGPDGELEAGLPDVTPGEVTELHSPREVTRRGPEVVDKVLPQAFVAQSEDQLPPGRDAMGRVGDLVLTNQHLTVVVGAAGHAKWGPFGGGILDLVPAGAQDRFQELFPLAGFIRGVRPESVAVLKDGSDGEAVVRVVGVDGPIPIIEAAIKMGFHGLEATVDYVLFEDSRFVEIRTTITNTTDMARKVPAGDGLVFADGGRLFGSQVGFDTDAVLAQSNLEFLGAETSEVSFLLVPSGASMAVALAEDELTPVLYDFEELGPGETRQVNRRLYAAPGRSIRVLERLWQDRGLALHPMEGRLLVDTEGYDFQRAFIALTRDDLFTGAVGPAPDGTFSFLAPPGIWGAQVAGEGLGAAATTWEAPAGEGVQGLELDPQDPGRLDVRVTGPDGETMPGRVSLQPGPEASTGAPLVAVIPTLDGEATFFVPEGAYTVLGSRGGDYSLCTVEVTVEAGETVAGECELARQIDTTGWVAADLHVHSEFSIDSEMPRESRVKAMIAEGLDFFSSTEHDVFTDFTDIIDEMGASGLFSSSVGNEVSLLFGHFNCLGCQGEGWSYMEASWVAFDEEGEVEGIKKAPEVWKLLREDFAATIIQINHPRVGTAYFDYINYDPALGPDALEPGLLDDNFDAIEVWNAKEDWPHLEGKTLPDWYGFLNRDLRPIATGNSDSHGLSQWVGQPHNLVRADSAAEKDVYGSLKQFRSQVTSAPFIDFTVNGEGLGAQVVPPASELELEFFIRVQAPTWAPLEKVRLVGNGETVEEWDVAQESGVVRLETSLLLTPQQDTWYHVAAWSLNGSLAPIYPGRSSMAFTNPIWVDLAGDGFSPPIPRAQ